MIRSYSELIRLHTFEERYEYLALRRDVGFSTFGFDRYINQKFYSSYEWKQIRHQIIARDHGCDLGVLGWEIHYRPVIHHMNPMTVEDLKRGDYSVLDPEYLITTTHQTHNGIHFGDAKPPQLTMLVDRKKDDTKLW